MGGLTIFLIIVAGLVDMTDSTKFPTPSVSLRMILKGTQYYLSLQDGKIVARVRNFISRAFKFRVPLASYIQLTEYDITSWNFVNSKQAYP